MLTNQKLDVYVRYHGDIDGLARAGTVAEKTVISDNDWHLIDSYLTDINLENKGLLSDAYLQKHKADMLANCENDEVVARLNRIVTHDYELWQKKGLFERLMNWLFNSKG